MQGRRDRRFDVGEVLSGIEMPPDLWLATDEQDSAPRELVDAARHPPRGMCARPSGNHAKSPPEGSPAGCLAI
jgi:hypothetical protein